MVKMKLGMDMHHGFIEGEMSIENQLEMVKEAGLDGAYFKSPLYISKTLDKGEIRYYKQMADDLGIYLDFGVGRVNPYNTNETPWIWELTGGDYLKAMELQILAGAEMGCRDFIGVTAGWKGNHKGLFVYDRFRTDVDWSDQLAATAKFLKKLAPILRDTHTRIDLETHEEITTFEILHLIEEVGDDVLGIAFDTANVVARAEEPAAVAKRVAPYTHQMHAKDCIVFFTEKGLTRQVRPCGEGLVDFGSIFGLLMQHDKETHIQIEDHKGYMPLNLYEEHWLSMHPELQLPEVMKLVEDAKQFQDRLAAGLEMAPEEYEKIPYTKQRSQRLNQSITYLRGLLARYEG